MPYKMFRQNGKYCVKNSETGDNKGCSATLSMAVKHMRALYAAEGGAKMGKKEEIQPLSDAEIDALVNEAIMQFELEYPDDPSVNEDKEMHYSDAGWIRPGITSFADLEIAMAEEEKVSEMRDLISAYPTLASNILYSPDIEDKAAALKGLADELGERLADVSSEDYEDKECEGCDNEEKAKRSDVSEADKKRAVAEYGNVTYADPANKKYPIDTEEHIRAAWSYINMPKNAAKYPDKGAAIKRRIVAAWKKKIDKAGPPSAKELAFFERIYRAVKERLFSEKEEPNPEEGMLIWKEGGQYRWLTRYSNNFRDRDIPPEIIAAESHRNFVDMVDKGLAPLPELWLWHVPEWKIGQATMVAYDEAGFAISGGYFDKGCEQVAEWLSTKEDVAVSHGMPPKSVVRDKNDPSVIIKHTTAEISPLPSWAAANRLTDFYTLNKEADMAIPEKKRKFLVEQWGMPEKVLEGLEASNELAASNAKEVGLESKESEAIEPAAEPLAEATQTAETPVEEPAVEIPPATEPEKKEEDPQNGFPTRKEIADAFAVVIVPRLDKQDETITNLVKQVSDLTARLEEVQKKDEQKVANLAKETPLASLSSLIFGGSAIGNPATEVDGRESLAKSKPKETTPEQAQPTPVPFLNSMIAPVNKQ